MKKASILSIVVFAFAVCFTSCSKCYDCESELEIINGQDTIIETQTDEFCTANKDEVDAKEEDGWTCSAQ